MNMHAHERPYERPRTRLATAGTLLAAATALPAAVLAVPDTTANVIPAAVDALGLSNGQAAGLLRATGLSLPALLLTIPLAAVATRRLPAWAVLAGGLLVLLAGLGAARFAGSVPQVGIVRAAQGAGAGIALPASLVLVWERRSRPAAALWAGGLAAALLTAMPLALHVVPPPSAAAAPDWHLALAPFPWPALAALIAALLFPLMRDRRRRALPAPRRAERGRLVLPLVPAGGFAFLTVVAADGWSPGARLAVAALALPALLALALTGSRDATAGSPFGCAVVMVTTGLLTYPVAAPLAGLSAVAAHARGDAAGVPPAPFALAGAAALAGALASTRGEPRRAVLTGHGLMLAALPLGLAAPPSGAGLLAPLVPLGTGAGLALAASLRDAGAGAALFGLALCFPAVLTGQLLVLSLQSSWLLRERPVTEAGQVDALTGGYHAWLLVAAACAVLLAAASARAAAGTVRKGAATVPAEASASPGGG
ncbi:hypothetical protein AGRA3207_001716 [Actinomadura graeca]|uniref:MFS transporter n=1 Tax=Actinomadura graeca TaxID=2750812 RepID=A0ABX8QQ46_9ACTN|nr:hypothetical protein [Actinomadura graeca]QXJ20920.1 hypothetical protein AGRA3207_001716 [Actinomadura graeca]